MLSKGILVVLLLMAGDLRLVNAVKNRDQDAVRSLLKERVDVNTPEADGATPLAWAAHWNDAGVADLLIVAGANVNAANAYGVTPLSLACTNGSAAMVQRLLRAGADVNATLPTGETVLMTCARTGNVEAVTALLNRGANPDARDVERGQTALMWAIAENHIDAARALVAKGADFRIRSKGGFTAFLFAAQQGNVEIARFLLEAGTDINEASPENGSALVLSSASGREAFATFLLERGADANASDIYGMTALHYALGKGILDLAGVEYFSYRQPPANMPSLLAALLARGANPNAQVARDYPAYSRSPYRALTSLVGATPLFLAAAASDIDALRALLAAGADPKVPTRDNATSLMAAAGVARVQERSPEEDRSALEAVRLLLELGVDVNAVNARGQTALHGAAFTGADAIVQVLADRGAGLDVKDRSGKTPLAIADGEPVDGVFGVVNHKNTAALLRTLGAR